MDENRPLNLVLFFTNKVSLKLWDECGILERETALYKKLQKNNLNISLITYGNADDLKYANKLSGIKICCNQWRLPRLVYRKLLPLIHKSTLKNANIFKTNQTDGADSALECAKFWNKKFIVRCGYMWSDFSKLSDGEKSNSFRKSSKVEEKVFSAADHIIVTTDQMKHSILKRLTPSKNNISIIPNYVDTGLFTPRVKDNLKNNKRLCYIGRLIQEQKNIKSLLKAIRDLDVKLDIIGRGPLEKEIQSLSKNSSQIQFIGTVSNEKLPKYLHRCTAYILPSFYEGHPKALIEAMACGLPVIATNVPGINNLIIHEENGWLCDPNPESLQKGIKHVLADPILQKKLGKNARQYVVENFSLDKIAHQELSIYKQILSSSNDK